MLGPGNAGLVAAGHWRRRVDDAGASKGVCPRGSRRKCARSWDERAPTLLESGSSSEEMQVLAALHGHPCPDAQH